jgi:hypothetical protein
MDFSDLMNKEKYHGFTAYAKSKLYGLLFTFELARRFRRTPNLALTANAVHPGNVATRIGMNNGLLARMALNLYHHIPITRPRPLTPEQGAETVLYLATDSDVAAFNGKYFVDHEVKATSVPSYDHDAAAHLWGISETLIRTHVSALQAQPEAETSPPAGPSGSPLAGNQ